MTDTQGRLPTDPGPFQKYLFSGACYVQLGECYRLLVETVERGESAYANPQLSAMLAALWHDQTMRRSAMAALMPGFAQSASQSLPRSISVALQDTGLQVSASLLAQFDQDANVASADTVPDFAEFYLRWLNACASAWDDFIRSDEFATLFAETMNLWIRSNR